MATGDYKWWHILVLPFMPLVALWHSGKAWIALVGVGAAVGFLIAKMLGV